MLMMKNGQNLILTNDIIDDLIQAAEVQIYCAKYHDHIEPSYCINLRKGIEILKELKS